MIHMKYRIVVDCSAEDLFQTLTESFKMTYKQEVKKDVTEAALQHHLSFQTHDKRTIKVLQYKKNECFSMEVKGENFHKVDSMWFKKLEDEQTEFTYEKFEERFEDGISVSTKGSIDSEMIGKAPLFDRIKFKQLAKILKKDHKV